MTGRPLQFDDPSRFALQESREIYLQRLRTLAPDSTYFSHQNALCKFFSWHSSPPGRTRPPETALAEFAEHLLISLDLCMDTAIGHVHSLLNYLAFHHQLSPDTLRMRFASEIQSLSCSESDKETLINEFGFHANPETICSVDALRRYLRQRQYATRPHAYVEFIYTARARPKQIRALNRSDLTLDEQTASIPLPDTYIIATNGLHEERTAPLSGHLTDILDTYIEYERDTPSPTDCQPLFTTTHGRASNGTLRRGVKLASEKAQEHHALTCESTLDEQIPSSSISDVLPSDIWRVALSEVGDNQ